MKKPSLPGSRFPGRRAFVRATTAVVWRKACRDLVAVQVFAAASSPAAWRAA